MEVALRHRFPRIGMIGGTTVEMMISSTSFETETSQFGKRLPSMHVSIRGLQGISCYPPVTDQIPIFIYTTDDIRIPYIKSKKHVHLLQVNGA